LPDQNAAGVSPWARVGMTKAQFAKEHEIPEFLLIDPATEPQRVKRPEPPKRELIIMARQAGKASDPAAGAATGKGGKAEAPAKGKAQATAPAAGKGAKGDKGAGSAPAAKGAGTRAAAAAKGKGQAAPAKGKGEGVKLDAFGLKVGSKKSQAAALYARKGGATLDEVKKAINSPQLNVLAELKEAGFTVETKKEAGAGAKKITRYFLKAKK